MKIVWITAGIILALILIFFVLFDIALIKVAQSQKAMEEEPGCFKAFSDIGQSDTDIW